MSQQELLRGVVAALDRAGIDYMVTGSVASSLHGEPRSTHDVDLLVAIDVAAARKLLESRFALKDINRGGAVSAERC